MEFSRIDNVSLVDVVKKQLTEKIISGELLPGDRLPAERDMAANMGISRSSVHQAVLALESEGLLSINPRKGTIVCDFKNNPTPQSLTALMGYGSIDLDYSLFKDMMETRIWLESECVRKACDCITKENIDDLKRIVDEMEKDDADLETLIYSFHYNLVKASQNSVFTMIFRGFEQVIRLLISQHYLVQSTDIKESVNLSRELIIAIEGNNPSLAVELINKIINQGVEVLKKRYD